MSAAHILWPSLIVPCDDSAAGRAGWFRQYLSGTTAELVQVGASKETVAAAMRVMKDALREADGENHQAQVIFLSTCGEDDGALRTLEDAVGVAAESFPWPLRRHHVLCPAPGRPATSADVPFLSAGAWFVGPQAAADAGFHEPAVRERLRALLTLLCLTDWRDRLHDRAVREFFVPRLPFPDEPVVRLVGAPKQSPFGARKALSEALVGEAVRRAAGSKEALEAADRAAEQIVADAGLRKRVAEAVEEQAVSLPLDVALRLCGSVLAKLDARATTADAAADATNGSPTPDDDSRMTFGQRMAARFARGRGLVCYLPRRNEPLRPAPKALTPEQRKSLEARGRLFDNLCAQVAERTALPEAPPELLDATARRTREALAHALARRASASPAVDAESVLSEATRQIIDDAGPRIWEAGAGWGKKIEACAEIVVELETEDFGHFGNGVAAPRLAAATAGFGGSIPAAKGRLPLAEVAACPGGGEAFLVVSSFVPARLAFA